jgi:hypothetical protein
LLLLLELLHGLLLVNLSLLGLLGSLLLLQSLSLSLCLCLSLCLGLGLRLSLLLLLGKLLSLDLLLLLLLELSLVLDLDLLLSHLKGLLLNLLLSDGLVRLEVRSRLGLGDNLLRLLLLHQGL